MRTSSLATTSPLPPHAYSRVRLRWLAPAPRNSRSQPEKDLLVEWAVLVADEQRRDPIGIGDQQLRILGIRRQVEHEFGYIRLAWPERLRERSEFASFQLDRFAALRQRSKP